MTRCGSCWLECFDYLLPDFKGSLYSWIVFIIMNSVFFYLFVQMISSMLNSPVVSPSSYRMPHQYGETAMPMALSDPMDKTTGIFTFLQVTDLHLSEKVPSNSKNVEEILEKARDIFNPAYVVFTGDLVDAFNIGFSQGEPDWIEYARIINKFELNDPDLLMDIKGNHDVYGIASQMSPSNYYCKYSVIGNYEEEGNYLYDICQKWKKGKEENKLLNITYTEEYKSHIFFKDLEIVDNDEGNDENLNPHIYRFLAIDYTPVPSTPFPMNFLVQIPISFVYEIMNRKLLLDGTMDRESKNGLKISSVVASHYMSSQVSVVSDESYLGKPMLVGVLDQIGVDVVIAGHSHTLSLACNADTVVELELVQAYSDDFNSRLFVYDNYGEVLSFVNIPKDMVNRPLPVILFPPHSSFPISKEMINITETRSKIRVMVYLDDFYYDPDDENSINTFKETVSHVVVKAYIYHPYNNLLKVVTLQPKIEKDDDSLPELINAPIINKYNEEGEKTRKLAAFNKGSDKLHAILYTGDWIDVLDMMKDKKTNQVGYIKILCKYEKNIKLINVHSDDANDTKLIYGVSLQPFSLRGLTTNANWFVELSDKAEKDETMTHSDNINDVEQDHSSWSIKNIFNEDKIYNKISSMVSELGESTEKDIHVLNSLKKYSTLTEDEENIFNINILPLFSSKPGFDVINWVEKIIWNGKIYKSIYYSLTLFSFVLTFFISISRLISFFIFDRRSVSFRFVRKMEKGNKRSRSSADWDSFRNSVNGLIDDGNLLNPNLDIKDMNQQAGSDEVNFVIPVRKRSFSLIPLLRNPYQFCLSLLSVIVLCLGFIMVMSAEVSGFHEESASIYVRYFGPPEIRVSVPEITKENKVEEEVVLQVDGNLFLLIIVFGGLSLCFTDGASLVLSLLSYFRLRTDWENISMYIKKSYRTRNMIDKATKEVKYGFSIQGIDLEENGPNTPNGCNSADSPKSSCIKKINDVPKHTIIDKKLVDNSYGNDYGDYSDDDQAPHYKNIMINNYNTERSDSITNSIDMQFSPIVNPSKLRNVHGFNNPETPHPLASMMDDLENSSQTNTSGYESTNINKRRKSVQFATSGCLSIEKGIGRNENVDKIMDIKTNVGNFNYLHPSRSDGTYLGQIELTQRNNNSTTDDINTLAEEFVGSPEWSNNNGENYKPDITSFTRHCGLCIDVYCCCICCDCAKVKNCLKLGQIFNYEFWTLSLGFIQLNLVSFMSALYMSLKVWTGLNIDLDIWYLAINIITVLIMIVSIIVYFIFDDNRGCIKNRSIIVLVSFLILSILVQIFTQYFVGINIIVPKLYDENNIAIGMIVCIIQEVIIYFTFTLIDIIIVLALKIVIVRNDINYNVPIEKHGKKKNKKNKNDSSRPKKENKK